MTGQTETEGEAPNLFGALPRGRFEPLVKAATVAEDPAAAWADYVRDLGAQTPGHGEMRLYPIIAHRIKTTGKTAVAGALLQREYRAAKLLYLSDEAGWTDVRSALRGIGAEPVFLKGIALKLLAYPHPWLRRTGDVDIYLPRAVAHEAYDVLRAAGWTATHADHVDRLGMAFFLDRAVSLTMERPDGLQLDMHWTPRRYLDFAPKWTDWFERTSVRFSLDEDGLRLPCATWLLYETITHGLCHSPVAPIRWIVDAWQLVSLDRKSAFAARTIDWTTLFELGAATRTTALIHMALHEMDRLGMALPDPARQWLAQTRPSRLERFERWWILRRWPVLPGATVSAFCHFWMRSPGSGLRRIASFPNYVVQDVGGYDGMGQAMTRLWRRTTGRS